VCFMSLMPRGPKASVKAVSQGKPKQPPKILISYNQLAGGYGLGTMESLEPQEGDVAGMGRPAQGPEDEGLMFPLPLEKQACALRNVPGKAAAGRYEPPSCKWTGNLFLQPAHGEICSHVDLVLLHTFVKDHQLLILTSILLFAQLDSQNPSQLQCYKRCDSIWGCH